MIITCWDIAEMSIDAARDLYPDAEVRTGVLSHIKTDCDALDQIFAENDGEKIKAEVDQDTGDFKISLYCDLIEFLDGRSSPFFEVIKHTKSFSFRNEEDCVVADFIYGELFDLE